MRKGGIIVSQAAFSNKYNICKLLGTGLNGKVYLVEDKRLKVLRAMKIIPKKNNNEYGEFKKEALMLKNLRHPGIPIIYDMEEAQDYLYIIEEYIKGETLYERVATTGIMSREEIINLGIELCNPIIYLHQQANPILHLDIHPGNLIINGENVSLIDFDHARYSKISSPTVYGYDNRGCVVPKQKKLEDTGEKTDLYSLAAVLYYAGTGIFPNSADINMPINWGKELRNILSSCLYDNNEYGIEDIYRLKAELLKLRNNTNKKSSRRIAVVSGAKGSGATYLALGLTSYLRDMNISAIYEECNESGHMALVMKNCVREYDEYGTFKFKNIYIKTSIDNTEESSKKSASIHIEDYGTNIDKAIFEKPDYILFVCRASLWHINESLENIDKIKKINNYKLIYNLCSHQGAILNSDKIQIGKCYKFPYIANIMEDRKERNNILKKILEGIINIYGEERSSQEY